MNRASDSTSGNKPPSDRKPAPERIGISKITLDAELHARAKQKLAVVTEYAEAIRVGAVFLKDIDVATRDLQVRWQLRESVDVRDMLLDVLFFRNSAVYQGIRCLMDQWQYTAAEMLLRPLFEGTLTFEWCMLDPDDRAFRFRRTSCESTIEMADTGLCRLTPDSLATLRECVSWATERGHKKMPDVRQRTEEVQRSAAGLSYNLYKRLSKLTHASLENWTDYMPQLDTPEVYSLPPTMREAMMFCAVVGHLQRRNIELVGRWDPYLTYEGTTDLKKYYAERSSEYLRSTEDAVRSPQPEKS